MTANVVDFSEIDKTCVAAVGGKAANLAELANIAGIVVPRGFCVTTHAYSEVLRSSRQIDSLIGELENVAGDDTQCCAIGARIREHLSQLPVAQKLTEEIRAVWQQYGEHYAYAIRSSATAEDLPGTSFAGQQDTFLNITGFENILYHIRKCWASLFTDRAIIYRQRNGFSHQQVQLAVVVQQMVFPEVSGIMFTADPITGNRTITSINASFGLGEALVSGIVTADLYQVKRKDIIHKQIAEKKVAVYAIPQGGTVRQAIPHASRHKQALTDEEVFSLAQIGECIATHFESPQDIEWCLVDSTFYIVQSRPITTLYPVPAGINDKKVHVLMSFGHVQMMTDAMKPLGISVLRTLVPLGKGGKALSESSLLQPAGNRLYVDISPALEYRLGQKLLPGLLANADTVISRAVREYISRRDFKRQVARGKSLSLTFMRTILPKVLKVLQHIIFSSNEAVTDTVSRHLAFLVDENRRKLQNVQGIERIHSVQKVLSETLVTVLSYAGPYIAAGVLTFHIMENILQRWQVDGMKELQRIGRAPVGNVTTEMGLALGDVADTVRENPAAVKYLRETAQGQFSLSELEAVSGSKEIVAALAEFLKRYGMRGPGEIDITRPRWREEPANLITVLLSHIDGGHAGVHRQEFLAARQDAETAERCLLTKVRKTRWGFFRAAFMKRLVKSHRNLIALREHPKYFLVQNLDNCKKALLAEGEKLTSEGILRAADEVYWFSLPELSAICRSLKADRMLISKRQGEFLRHIALTPPRVMTSDGEIIIPNSSKEGIPANAIVGSPVSAGIVEGRARVIVDLRKAALTKGDILVAPYTDPAWTALFPLAGGLVTEAGGLMTHGAVVAREYGIPAVVGVDGATRIIKDGQRIRIDGRRGYIEVIS